MPLGVVTYAVQKTFIESGFRGMPRIKYGAVITTVGQKRRFAKASL